MLWDWINANKRFTCLFILVIGTLFCMFGASISMLYLGDDGISGLIIATLIWLGQLMVSLYWGDKIMLSLSNARKLERNDHPTLFNVVEEMQIASGMSRMPDVYLMDEAAPNAFATGRDPQHASIAVTSGLLQLLTRQELQGVIGHELAHINNRDSLYMVTLGSMVGTMVLISEFLWRSRLRSSGTRSSSNNSNGAAELVIFLIVLLIIMVAPLLAQLIYFAFSRKREFLADACSVQYTRYPEGLASALNKIALCPDKIAHPSRMVTPLYIVNPTLKETDPNKKPGILWNSTHPSVWDRIRVLSRLGGNVSLSHYQSIYQTVTGKSDLIKAKALANLPAIIPVITEAEMQTTDDPLARTRETMGCLWKLNGYTPIACSCGTTLKIPPDYPHDTIACPHCGKTHPTNVSGLPTDEPVGAI